MGKTYNWNIGKTVAQLVMPRLETEKFFSDSAYKQNAIELTKKGIGGFCVFGGKYDTAMLMLNELQSFAETPLIFSADMEYGLPMRFEDGTEFPHHLALGNTDNTDYSEQTGSEISKEAKNMGIRWNFAPVADINSNPLNPVINIRSFGDNEKIVSEHTAAFINGTQKNKVLATAKHFPGHGDTDKDSHLELPVLEHSYEKIINQDMAPFRKSIEAGVKAIMTGHLAVPALDESGKPASLSSATINILRNELNFKGLIITDALEMKSISAKYNSGEAAYLALKAGNDIALMPENPEEAIDFVSKKAENDKDFLENLHKSAERLIENKRWCGLIPFFADADFQPKTFTENQKKALLIADSGIKYEGNKSLIPLPEDKQFAGFAFLQNEKDLKSASRFFTMLAQAVENDVDFAFFDKNIDEENLAELINGTEDAEFILFPVFLKGGAYSESIDIGAFLNDKISKLANGKPAIVILFGTPYIKDKIKSDLTIMTFSDSFASLAASVVHLSGRREALKL